MSQIAAKETKSIRPFLILWSGQAVSLFGSQLVQFALIWWLTQRTGSATILAAASLVGLLPQVVLGPFVGVLVDRWPRRQIMMVADSIIALATLVLAYLFWAQTIQIWHLFTLLFIRALGGAFHFPAMQASTSLMVPKEQLTRIQGFNQMLQGGLNIVSAPLGALLLGLLPMQGILAIDVVTALFAIVPLFFIVVPQPPTQTPTGEQPAKSSFWVELRLGFRYVWSWPGILILMFMAMFVNLMLTPASALMPLLVTEHFGGDAIQLGALESLFGIGVVAGGITLGAWGGFKRRILTTLVGLIGAGIGFSFIGFAPANMFWLAITAAFIVGVMIPMVNGPVMAIFQAAIAPEMQGRLFTLLTSLAAAMSPLGLIIAGPVADTFGIQSWYIAGGIGTALIGLAGFFIPAVLTVEDGRSTTSEETAHNEVPAGIGETVVETAVTD